MTDTSGAVRALSVFLVILSAGCVRDGAGDAAAPAEEVTQVDADDSAFTYSIIDLTSDRAAVVASLQARVMPTVVEAGATPYSVWLPLEVTEEALRRALSSTGGARTPFTPLGEAQLGLMLAWPGQGVQVEVPSRGIDSWSATACGWKVPEAPSPQIVPRNRASSQRLQLPAAGSWV